MAAYKQSEADKTIEKVLAYPIITTGYILYYFVIGIIILFSERNRYKIFASLLAIVITIIDVLIVFPKHLIANNIIHLLICLAPILCISFIGYSTKRSMNFDPEFKEIGFFNRGEKTPELIYKADKVNLANQKYRIYVFKTLIPVSKWLLQKESIENILADPKKDYTHSINHIERSGNKKIKIYTTYNLNFYDYSNQKVRIGWNDKFLDKYSDSIIILGLDKMYLNVVKIDLDDKNILLAGEPGSGKSVELKLIVWQLYKHNWELELSDFKSGAEFNEDFEKIAEVITDRKSFFYKVKELFEESERRMRLFRSAKKNNIKSYNKKALLGDKLRRKALVVDELSCILDETGMDKDDLKLITKIEFYLSELARKGRAAGIHLILCMQRPDADIIKGQIKNMLGIRISGRFADGTASKIILDNTMATQLPAIQGRMVLKNGADLKEFQGYYFDMEDYSEELYSKKDPITIQDKNPNAIKNKLIDFKNAIESKNKKTSHYNFKPSNEFANTKPSSPSNDDEFEISHYNYMDYMEFKKNKDFSKSKNKHIED